MPTEYPMITCCECGTTEEAYFQPEVVARMVENNWCFNCMFWNDIINNWSDENVCVEGHVYNVRNAPAQQAIKGHGGTKFYCRRTGSDTVVEYNDVWHRGKVPHHFRERIKDNAVFVPPRTETKLDG